MLIEVLKWVGDTIAWTIGIPLIGFMVVYGSVSRWRDDPLGVERMFEKGYLLALWLVIMAGNFLPDPFDLFRMVARIVIFAVVTIMLSMQVVNLRRVQNGKDEPLFFTWMTYRAGAARRARRRR